MILTNKQEKRLNNLVKNYGQNHLNYFTLFLYL